MTPTIRTRAARRAAQGLVVVTVALGGVLGVAGAAQAAPDDGTNGIGLSVVVPQPTPTSTGSPSGTGSTGSGTTTSGSKTATAVTPVSQTSSTSDSNGLDLGGVVFVSGLTTRHLPSLNPAQGSLAVEFTVRNISEQPMDATAHFWVDGPFGNTLSDIDGVAIDHLKSGETRVVAATLPGIGQWTVLNAHAVFTPPASVDGVKLSAVTRDATVLAAPWFSILSLGIVIAAVLIVGALQRVRLGRLGDVSPEISPEISPELGPEVSA